MQSFDFNQFSGSFDLLIHNDSYSRKKNEPSSFPQSRFDYLHFDGHFLAKNIFRDVFLKVFISTGDFLIRLETAKQV